MQSQGLKSFQLVQMFQSGQDNLLAGLFDLACKEDLVQNGIDLNNSQSTTLAICPTFPTRAHFSHPLWHHERTL